MPENLHPRHPRGFLWSDEQNVSVTPSDALSESLRPTPGPPPSELNNTTAWRTITSHPELFDVVTPVDVDRFEAALRTHPNRPLVESVVSGLREGFWPFADFEGLTFPVTWDEVSRQELTPEALEFIQQHAADEERLGRYSAVFGADLLPGMYSMPLYAVPKAETGKLRLVNDHSAGDFALNTGIDKEDVGMRQDNIQDLRTHLTSARDTLGDIPLWLFKSDVSNAYRLLPMHPLWQIRQIIAVDGKRRVDRCCCFGSRGSPDLWCSFMSPVLGRP